MGLVKRLLCVRRHQSVPCANLFKDLGLCICAVMCYKRKNYSRTGLLWAWCADLVFLWYERLSLKINDVLVIVVVINVSWLVPNYAKRSLLSNRKKPVALNSHCLDLCLKEHPPITAERRNLKFMMTNGGFVRWSSMFLSPFLKARYNANHWRLCM